jgi:hypothetical protein
VIVGGAVARTVSVNTAPSTFPAPSVTWISKFEVPAAVGVPASVPAVESVNPAGSVPYVTAHVKEVEKEQSENAPKVSE